MPKIVGEVPGTIYQPSANASEFTYSYNNDDVKYMRLALEQAEIALEQGDMPVGAVLVNSTGDTWAAPADEKATNRLNGHAERNVIEKYNIDTGILALTGLQMYVTFEPCLACSHTIDQGELGFLFVALSRDTLTEAAKQYGGDHLIRPRNVNMPQVLHDSPRTLIVVREIEQRTSIDLFRRKYEQDHGIFTSSRIKRPRSHQSSTS